MAVYHYGDPMIEMSPPLTGHAQLAVGESDGANFRMHSNWYGSAARISDDTYVLVGTPPDRLGEVWLEVIQFSGTTVRSLATYPHPGGQNPAFFNVAADTPITRSSVSNRGLVLHSWHTPGVPYQSLARYGLDGSRTVGPMLPQFPDMYYLENLGVYRGRSSTGELVLRTAVINADLSVDVSAARTFTIPGYPGADVNVLDMFGDGTLAYEYWPTGAANYTAAGRINLATGAMDASLMADFALPDGGHFTGPLRPVPDVQQPGPILAWPQSVTGAIMTAQFLLDSSLHLLDQLVMPSAYEFSDDTGRPMIFTSSPIYDDAGSPSSFLNTFYTVAAGKFAPFVDLRWVVGQATQELPINGAGSRIYNLTTYNQPVAATFTMWEFLTTARRAVPLRLGQRDDGLGPAGNPRLRAGAGAGTSTQSRGAPRLGSTYS